MQASEFRNRTLSGLKDATKQSARHGQMSAERHGSADDAFHNLSASGQNATSAQRLLPVKPDIQAQQAGVDGLAIGLNRLVFAFTAHGPHRITKLQKSAVLAKFNLATAAAKLKLTVSHCQIAQILQIARS